VNFNDLYQLVLEASEPSIEDLDKVFADLLQQEKQAGAPVVVQTIIEQMTMIKEQLKKERELKNYQRLKLLMIQQIKQLKQALGDDPKLITAYNDFLERYTKNKKVQLQEAAALKDRIEDEIHNLRMTWIDISRNIGVIENSSAIGRWKFIEDIGAMLDAIDPNMTIGEKSSIRGFINFIKQLEQKLPGYDWIDLEPPRAFLDQFLTFLAELVRDLQTDIMKRTNMPGMSDERRELIQFKQKNLDELIENTKTFASYIRDVSKILNEVRALLRKTDLELLGKLNPIKDPGSSAPKDIEGEDLPVPGEIEKELEKELGKLGA